MSRSFKKKPISEEFKKYMPELYEELKERLDKNNICKSLPDSLNWCDPTTYKKDASDGMDIS